MPLLRCDICGCAVSQVKSVFVCDQCQPPYATIAALHARVAELEAAQRWIPMAERLPDDGQLIAIFNGAEYEALIWQSRYNFKKDLTVGLWRLLQPPEVK